MRSQSPISAALTQKARKSLGGTASGASGASYDTASLIEPNRAAVCVTVLNRCHHEYHGNGPVLALSSEQQKTLRGRTLGPISPHLRVFLGLFILTLPLANPW